MAAFLDGLFVQPAKIVQRALLQPHLCAVLAMVLWAGSFVVSREARELAPPVWLSFWRNTIAFMILFALCLPHIKRDIAAMLHNWRRLGLVGACLIIGNTAMTIGLIETTVVNAGIINAAEPALIIMLACLVARRMITVRQVGGILVSFLGVLILITRAHLDALAAFDFNDGDLWMTGAIVSWSVYVIVLQRAPMVDRPISQTTAVTFYASIVLLPWYTWELTHRPPVTLTFENVASIVYLALFASVIGVLFWVRAVRYLGPARTGPFGHLMPVFSILLGIVFLGESLYAYHAGGMVLIACGIYLTSFGGPRTATA